MSDDLDAESYPDDEFVDGSIQAQVSSDGHHRLQVFRDLTIERGVDRLDEFISSLAEIVRPPWRRAAERDVPPSGLGEWRVFERDADELLPGALLFFVPRDRDGAVYVSNIVPTRGHSLGKSNYNSILAEFTDAYVRQVSTLTGLTVTLTDPWIDFAEEIGEEAFQVLRAAAIFKPGTHPMDRERWMRFIVLTHRLQIEADAELLCRWLEADGFAPDRAHELTAEFDFGRDLLKLERQS